MFKGPRFLGIGAQKAGTTWLWKVMRDHPKIWLPPIKELHWFDVVYPPASLSKDEIFRHRTGVSRYRPFVRDVWQGKGNIAELNWLWNFYHNNQSDESYLSLLTRTDGRVSGEITPAYAILDEEAVQRIHALVEPDCNILFIMREPVARLWSAMRMYCRQKGIDASKLTIEQFDSITKLPGQRLRTDYRVTLDRWSIFGDRLGLFFYEDLVDNPSEFLSQILRFLGLDTDLSFLVLDQSINVGKELEMPIELAERWHERYRPIVDAVSEKVGRLPAGWAKQL
ncbi:MAG: sulfotransferase [Nitrosomonas sp.]|nr:MAG: sulfotransferase [Nitrosomonas sp.]